MARSAEPVVAANGLSVNPAHLLHACPAPDVLVIPGGIGTRGLLNEPEIIDWIRQTAAAGLGHLPRAA